MKWVLSAGSQLNLLEISNILEQQVAAGPERNAINHAPCTLFHKTLPPTPLFDGVPGFGVVMSDRAQQFDYAYDLGIPGYNK